MHLYRPGPDRLWQDAVLKGLDAVVELEKLKILVPLRLLVGSMPPNQSIVKHLSDQCRNEPD